MIVKIVIGKNFGDEGKGLATDYISCNAIKEKNSSICVRHNGGAQAGHTVDFHDRRFVFSQLSSASFREIDTYWADSFIPDLFKLDSELNAFSAFNDQIPNIYASSNCRCSYIGDILINMILERSRGKNRHGSCGMGINEAVIRSESFDLRLGDVVGCSSEKLYNKLKYIKKEYTYKRLNELSIDPNKAGEFGEMLQSEKVLQNAAENMIRNAELICLREADSLLNFDEVIFEGAQGLLLDELYIQYAPHLTSSHTGLYEPIRILESLKNTNIIFDIEVIYVTRSYVTRHGVGPLPYEDVSMSDDYNIIDRTNVKNEWQGTLRFASHGDYDEFLTPVINDMEDYNYLFKKSLMITHINESGGCVITKEGNIPVKEFCNNKKIKELFECFLISDSPYSENIVVL